MKEEHIFKSCRKIITIKLIIKENINEINMYKMFANCSNLISLNGISKFKRTKVINMSKMFYNCTSLSSIQDITDWNLSLINNTYLMFYDCISLILYQNIDKLNLKNINIKKKLFLGILLSNCLIYEKEIWNICFMNARN